MGSKPESWIKSQSSSESNANVDRNGNANIEKNVVNKPEKASAEKAFAEQASADQTSTKTASADVSSLFMKTKTSCLKVIAANVDAYKPSTFKV